MSDPFISEIRVMGFNFPPKGWAQCNGQILPINQNQALYSLIGTTYGGNGTTTFALPDMRGRVPLHFGNGFPLGQHGGESSHTLTLQETPAHGHTLNGTSTAANTNVPDNTGYLATVNNTYTGSSANLTAMAAGEVGSTGGSQPHENNQPYLTLNYCIALIGIFPSRN